MARNLRHLNVGGIALLVALAALWQLAVGASLIDLDYLPAPTEVVQAGVEQVEAGALVTATLHTLGVALAAWLIALVLGVALGLLLGFSAAARMVFTTSVEVLRTLPVVAFVPVAVLVFGLSTRMEVVVAAWAALWPIVINTLGGVEAVPARLHEVAAVFRLSGARRIRSIVLPAAAPLILVGARLGLSFALIVAVVAEMIGNPQGLGHLVIRTQQALRTEAMFAGILVIGLLGVALNAALLALTARAAPDMFEPGKRS